MHDLALSTSAPPWNKSRWAAKVHMPIANNETSWHLRVECIVPVSQWKDFDLLNTWHGQMDTIWFIYFCRCALPRLLIPSLMFITHHANHALPFFPPDTKEATPEWNENLRRLCEIGPKPIKHQTLKTSHQWKMTDSKWLKINQVFELSNTNHYDMAVAWILLQPANALLYHAVVCVKRRPQDLSGEFLREFSHLSFIGLTAVRLNLIQCLQWFSHFQETFAIQLWSALFIERLQEIDAIQGSDMSEPVSSNWLNLNLLHSNAAHPCSPALLAWATTQPARGYTFPSNRTRVRLLFWDCGITLFRLPLKVKAFTIFGIVEDKARRWISTWGTETERIWTSI